MFLFVRYTGYGMQNVTEQCKSCFYVLLAYEMSHVPHSRRSADLSPDNWAGDDGNHHDRESGDREVFIYLKITRYLLSAEDNKPFNQLCCGICSYAVEFLVCFAAFFPTFFLN
jgi:hypothetical protein